MRLPAASRLIACLLAGLPLAAEEPAFEVNPNRPTFANPALTTRPGQAELEWGGQQTRQRDDSLAFSTPTLLKFGLMQDLELRLTTPGYLRLSPAGGEPASGPGDLNLGVQWCYRHDGLFDMDQALQVNHTFPTASASRGLGGGAPSDGLILIFSRDLGAHHLDVNLLETWLGRPAGEGGGRVRQPAATASLSRTITEAWSVTGEVYAIGGTALNPRVVSNLWALGYKVSPRLVLDAGLDLGLTRGSQRVSVFAGLTVGLARFRPLR